MDPLSPVEARVLGALAEKDLSTPDYYPLTLNSLTAACNQSSNRDPVMALGEAVVTDALNRLRERRLAYMVQGADSRVAKFGHRLVETLGLARPDVALLAVLLLRGPQTVGELRGRTGRLQEFATLEEAEAALQALAVRTPEPLVVRLPRQPGLKEQRYAQLFSGPVEVEAPAPQEVPLGPDEGRLARAEAELTALRAEVAALRAEVGEFRKLLS